ncbi:hypothetical protein CSKR_111124, partial [Clonorchis sinensis]
MAYFFRKKKTVKMKYTDAPTTGERLPETLLRELSAEFSIQLDGLMLMSDAKTHHTELELEFSIGVYSFLPIEINRKPNCVKSAKPIVFDARFKFVITVTSNMRDLLFEYESHSPGDRIVTATSSTQLTHFSTLQVAFWGSGPQHFDILVFPVFRQKRLSHAHVTPACPAPRCTVPRCYLV